MDKRGDPEEILKRPECAPSEKVKRAVISRYAQTYQAAKKTPFWRKGVPLYQTVAAVFVAALISAFSVGMVTGPEPRPVIESVKTDKTVPVPEIKPYIALNDRL